VINRLLPGADWKRGVCRLSHGRDSPAVPCAGIDSRYQQPGTVPPHNTVHKSSEPPWQRLYALAGLADDWEWHRQTCIEVLCGYLRLPYEADPTSSDYRKGEKEVRRTIIRVIRDHLQGFSDVSWCSYNFSFEGAIFDCGDLTGAWFTGGHVSFHGAHFVSGTFHFNNIRFDGAHVWFGRAHFSGADVRFDKAQFLSGKVTFDGARHNGEMSRSIKLLQLNVTLIGGPLSRSPKADLKPY
jgi:hypothetical protein